MAEQVLYFQGQQIGDSFVKMVPLHQSLTPPVARAGLFQDYAEAVTPEGRNLVRRKQAVVSLKRNTPWELERDIALIEELIGLSGDVELREGAATIWLLEDWLLESVGIPDVLDGFGGRFAPALPLIFAGNTPAVY